MSKTLRTYGTKPVGTALGTERWVQVDVDDTVLVITAHTGWGQTDEVRLSGDTATNPSLVRSIIDTLLVKS